MSSPYRESVRCEPEVIRPPRKPLSKHVLHGGLLLLSLPMFDIFYELNMTYPSGHTTWWTAVVIVAGIINVVAWFVRCA